MLECKTEKRNSQCEHGLPMEQTRGLFCTCESDVITLSITTPVSLLANEFDARSALHGQVSLAAVNHILYDSLGYERLHKSTHSLKACFENVNINEWMFTSYHRWSVSDVTSFL